MAGKFKIIISDLHLGAGWANEGGNLLEDFVSDDDLVRFLHEVYLESIEAEREVELIINGDVFEFLQVPAVDVFDPGQSYTQDDYLDSSESASVKRLELIAAGHPAVFEALADFIHVEPPKRRITIIKGDHDVNLYWPMVKSKLREILGATGTRADALVFAEEFFSREGLYIEHGHQYAEALNRFPDFIDPRRLPDRPDQLYYPPASRFVIGFLSEAERRHWWVDQIRPLTGLIWCSLPWDLAFAGRLLAAMAALLAPGAAGSAADVPLPELLQRLAAGPEPADPAGRYQTSADFRRELHQAIHDWLVRVGLTPPADVAPALEVREDALQMASAEQQAWHAVLRQAAQAVARREGARVVLFAHTHRSTQQPLDAGATYINTGSWLWHGEGADGSGPPDFRALSRLERFQRPGRLPYARVDYDAAGVPRAQLLDFARGGRNEQGGPAAPAGLWARVRIWLGRMLGASQKSANEAR